MTKIESKRKRDYQVDSLRSWIEGYTSRHSEIPQELDLAATERRIGDLLELESDFDRVKLAEDLLLSLIKMDLLPEDKEKLVLRICAISPMKSEGSRNGINLSIPSYSSKDTSS